MGSLLLLGSGPSGGAVGGGGGAFNPTDISGLQLWLKADAGTFQDAARTTPATANSDPVGGWADQSGNGNHALRQLIDANRLTLVTGSQNGLPGLAAGSAGQSMSVAGLALVDPFTLFVVAKRSASDGDFGRLVVGPAQQNPSILWDTAANTTTVYFTAQAGSLITHTAGSSVRNAMVYTFVCNQASSAAYTNGGSGTTGSLVAVSKTGLGIFSRSGSPSTEQGFGTIYELLYYNTALSTTDRQAVQTYLGVRWGISVS